MFKNLKSNQCVFICLGLMIITFAVYYQVHNFSFIAYDDNLYVYENPNIQNGINLKNIKWAFTTGRAGNWHPLTWLSHTLDWQLFKNNAGGHHLTNLFFHILNTLLLFIALKIMTDAIWPSAFAAALFALHPVHIESVAWIAERKDVLSTFFWLITMLVYTRFVKRPGIINYLLVVIFFVLGLMAKSMLVTLPLVLLLLDYWPLERFASVNGHGKKSTSPFSLKTVYPLIMEKVPLLIISAVFCVVTFFAQRGSGAVLSTSVIPFKARICNAIVSYTMYIEKMIWPNRLAVFYPYRTINMMLVPAMISLLILLAVSVLVLLLTIRGKYLFTGWFWYIGTLVPVIGLVQVGGQSMADRYTYIPYIGLFIIIAWGIPQLLKKLPFKRITLSFSAIAVLLILSVMTYSQLGYWKDSISLFQHALEVTEGNHTAYLCMSEALRKQGKINEAIQHCRLALQIVPDSVRARLNLAYTLAMAGKNDEAISEYQKVIQENPEDAIAINALGIEFMRQGKFDEAAEYFIRALQIRPNMADAHINLGNVLFLQGKFDEAIVHLEKDPYSEIGHYYLGQIMIQKGEINRAVLHLEESLRLKPGWKLPINNLAWLMATSENPKIKNPRKAVELAERVCAATDYKEPESLDTLAAAYAAEGNFNKAIETAEKAIELCTSPAHNVLKSEIGKRLELYKAGTSFIETH